MSKTPHDVLKEHDITPTTDAERAYRLGCNLGYELGLRDAAADGANGDELRAKIARLEQLMTEIGLLARRR